MNTDARMPSLRDKLLQEAEDAKKVEMEKLQEKLEEEEERSPKKLLKKGRPKKH